MTDMPVSDHSPRQRARPEKWPDPDQINYSTDRLQDCSQNLSIETAKKSNSPFQPAGSTPQRNWVSRAGHTQGPHEPGVNRLRRSQRWRVYLDASLCQSSYWAICEIFFEGRRVFFKLAQRENLASGQQLQLCSDECSRRGRRRRGNGEAVWQSSAKLWAALDKQLLSVPIL